MADRAIDDLVRRWAEAERAGDVATLSALFTDDVTLVGPLGFVLDRGQLLDRFRPGDLGIESLTWDEVSQRHHGDTAIVIGTVTQSASHRGRPADGRFRVTLVAVRAGLAWRLASLHYSPIAAPPV